MVSFSSLSLALPAFVWVSCSTSLGMAHSCSDGSRVTCTAVDKLSSAPSTYGQARNAVGYPLCSSSGSKLFCLVDHDYHKCSDGEAPCCADGSDPIHHGRHSEPRPEVASTADDATCKPELQFVLDDASASSTIVNMDDAVGAYGSCLKDAWKGGFRHDSAKNKGGGSATFIFNPPEDGCYMIEEYHPGSDPECNKHLPRNSHLRIDWCKGRTTNYSVNQAVRNGRWNEVARHPFYKGVPGAVTAQSLKAENCRESSCLLIADAYRFTHVGKRCVQRPSTSGILNLEANFQSEGSSGAVLAKFQEQEGVIAVALEAHLGYDSVEIASIRLVEQRLRRRLSEQGSASFKIQFNARGKTVPSTNGKNGIASSLTKRLAAVGVSVTVKAAEVDMSTAKASRVEGRDGDAFKFTTLHAVLSALAAFVVAAGVVIFMCRKSFRSTEQVVITDGDKPVEAHVIEAAVQESDKETNKNTDKWETASTSTGTPASAENKSGGSSDGISEEAVKAS